MTSVLIICPFDTIYPPMNGGMQRCFHIIHQLAKHSELTIVIKQDKEEFLLAKKEYPAIEKVRVFSTKVAVKPKDIFNLLPAKLQNALRYRWYKKRIRGSADGNYLAYYPIVKELLQKESFGSIILESPGTLNAAPLVRKYSKRARLIYDAHNVNTNLDAAFLQKKEISFGRYTATRKTESNLYKTVDAILCCSEKDRQDFDRMNGGHLTIAVIPNGVSVEPQLYDKAVRQEAPSYLLFCGYLGARPNSEGLWWFYRSIWPKVADNFPALKLIVLGSGNLPASMTNLLKDDSLVFTGPVADVKEFYNQSSLSIVPLKTGSGTRLKILEAMSFGVPVVSTSKGAEGIEYTDGMDIIIPDSEVAFANSIIDLLINKNKRLSLQRRARGLVQCKYDWHIIGDKLSEFINSDLKENEPASIN